MAGTPNNIVLSTLSTPPLKGAVAPLIATASALRDGSRSSGPTQAPLFTTSHTHNSITATITDARGATSYQVSVDGDNWFAGRTISSLSAETLYPFRVRGVNQYGTSPASDPVNVTTNAAPVASVGTIASINFENGDRTPATNDGNFVWDDYEKASVVTQDGTGPLQVWPSSARPGDMSQDWSAYQGTYALRFRYPTSGQNPEKAEARFSFDPTPEIWVQYWLRVPENFDHTHGNSKLFSMWMDEYENPTGGRVNWEFWSNGSGSDVSFYEHQGGAGGSEGHQQYTPFISTPGDRGRWMELTHHLIASSDQGVNDGVIELYQRWDGEAENERVRLHYRDDVLIPFPEGGPNGWAGGYFMGWANDGYAAETNWLMDNLVLSTESLLVTPIFTDDFATGDLSKTENGFQWLESVSCAVTTNNPKNGTHSLEFTFIKKVSEDEAWSEQNFDLGATYKELVIEYDLYVPDGTEGLGTIAYTHGDLNNKFLAMWGSNPSHDAGQNSYADSPYRTGYELYARTGGGARLVSKWIASGGSWTENPPGHVHTDFITPADLGTWVHMKIHMRFPSAVGANDGFNRAYKNDVLVVDNALDNYPQGAGYDKGWQQGYLLGYRNSMTASDQKMWIDNLDVKGVAV